MLKVFSLETCSYNSAMVQLGCSAAPALSLLGSSECTLHKMSQGCRLPGCALCWFRPEREQHKHKTNKRNRVFGAHETNTTDLRLTGFQNKRHLLSFLKTKLKIGKKQNKHKQKIQFARCRHDAPCWFTGSRSKTVSPLRLHSRATAFWMVPQLTLVLLAWAG